MQQNTLKTETVTETLNPFETVRDYLLDVQEDLLGMYAKVGDEPTMVFELIAVAFLLQLLGGNGDVLPFEVTYDTTELVRLAWDPDDLREDFLDLPDHLDDPEFVFGLTLDYLQAWAVHVWLLAHEVPGLEGFGPLPPKVRKPLIPALRLWKDILPF